MANQQDKRQPFRFWYPFWGNASASAPPLRPPAAASRPTPANQPSRTQLPATPAPTDKRTPRTPSLSPSASASASPSPSPSSRSPLSSPAKQNQPKRVSRTPSSSQPSPTQSPSRRPSRSDQVKQKMKDESAQGSTPSPQMIPASPSRSHSPSKDADKSPETSNQQGTSQEEKMTHTEPIETKTQDSKTIDANNGSNIEKPTSPTLNAEKENNGSKDLEKIEAKSIHFDPPTNDMSTETVIRDESSMKTDEQDLKKAQVPSDVSTDVNNNSETRPEEKKQAHNETHQEKTITDTNHPENDIMAPAQDDNSKEIIKEIARPVPDGNLKETIKEMSQTADVNNLGSDHKSKNGTTDVNNYSDNKPDPTKRENPVTNDHPRQKEKNVAGPSSTRTSFQKNIKDGISKLVQKINSSGSAFNPGSERGASIITLAGENNGASMCIGHENEGHNENFVGRAQKLNESSSAATLRKGKEKVETEKDVEEHEDSKIAANVNSNVQSINNSMLQESSCETRDPGVHLRLSSHLRKQKMKKKMSEGFN